jgi:hypothetical protein
MTDMTARRDLWVDFSEADAKGNLASLAEFITDARAQARVHPGARVTVGDHEGNLCEAEIVSVGSDGVVHMVLATETFVEADGLGSLLEA